MSAHRLLEKIGDPRREDNCGVAQYRNHRPRKRCIQKFSGRLMHAQKQAQLGRLSADMVHDHENGTDLRFVCIASVKKIQKNFYAQSVY